MKNYKEMAQSVLRRREIEIKRRKRAFLIGAPCAAAVLVGAAGIGTSVAANSRSGQLQELIHYTSDSNAVNGAADIGTAEIAEAVSSVDIAMVEPEQIDYTNPKVGQTIINITYVKELHMDNGADVDGCDFTEYTLDGLDRFYGLRFSRFSALYPEWELSYDKLGTYTKDYTENKAGLDVCVHELTSNRNTLNYTTEFGGKVSVIAQLSEFEPLSPDFAGSEEDASESFPNAVMHAEYDKKGKLIRQWTQGYDPTASRPADNANADNNKSGTYNSVINGYETAIYGQITKGTTSDVDFFAADIKMSSHVRIIAEGFTDEEFLIILDDFTNNVEGPVTANIKPNVKPTDYTNPNVGQNDIKVLELDEFNIPDDISNRIDLSNFTFKEYNFDELDRNYHLRFNILKELHPDWELSHDKLGTYDETLSDGKVLVHIWDRNTLNYTTDSCAKITVSTGGYLFQPISDETLTFMKPDDPSKFITEPAIADDGTQIGYLSRPIDPNDYLPEPDEGVSTVNGCEALIYRNADGNFLADLDMDSQTVRITAEGLSEEEFLNVLDEFTKYKM